MVDQDEAASYRSAGKGGERSTQRAREAGPPRRAPQRLGTADTRGAAEGGQRVLEGLRRQECIGAISV